MREQRQIWEDIHNNWRSRDSESSDFCLEAAAWLAPGSKVLEIGCGPGADAAYFASQGHEVLATDVSETAVQACSERYTDTAGKLQFARHDASGPLDAPDASFDVVYARLSLHYFTDGVTKSVFRELARLLKHGGLLAFQCKTVDDPEYGVGTLIEKDMYESNHVRHFFSEDYARECLAGLFSIESMRSEKGQLYGEASAYLKVIARLQA